MLTNNALQSFGVNTGSTFPGLSVKETNEIKEQSKLMSSNSYDQRLIQNDLHKQKLAEKQHEEFVNQRQAGRMELQQQAQNTKDKKTKDTTNSVKKIAALADMYRQYGYDHGKNWDSMGDEELISRFNTKNPQVKKLADNFLTGGEDSEYKLSQELGISGSLAETKAKSKLSNDFWNQTWANIKTMANVPVDSIKKWGHRTMNELGAEVYKKIIKNSVGDYIDGENVDKVFDATLDKVVKSEILDYQNEINARQQANIEKNIDQDVRNYYSNKGYTKLLTEGDRKGFLYKSLGDAAQNREMPVVIAASIFQPEVGFALMATDTYSRENQEAFENMLNNGADYEQAEQGAVAVGLINAAVEVGLERLLGGVETKASDAIRNTFMKNVQEEAVKKGLGRILLDAGKTQLRASSEEGLEEIVQQIVQNAAVKTVNENQGLFEGVGAAFEGGFYNPLNLLAGGGTLTQNMNQNVNQNVSKNVDKREIRQTIVNGTFDPKSIVNNTQGLYSMAPTLGNLQNTQSNGTTNNGQQKATFMEDLYSIDPTLKRRLQNNPYTAEVWQRTKSWIDQNGRPERANDVAKALIEDVADRVQEKLMEKMDEGTEAGKLYAPLKNSNYTVDLSELKNGIDSLLEEYGIKIEQYEGKDGKTKYDLDFSKTAIDGAEASNIKKIYNWLKDTESPMGIKEYKDRFRATLSDMVDFNPNGRDQAGRKVADTQGDKVLKAIRSKANDLAHNQIPVLADLDKTFAEWVKTMDEVSDGLVYKDKSKKGVIKDNITQIIKNLDEPSRRQLANRLETLIPGIKEEVSAINQMPKVIDHVYNPSKLQVTIRDKAGGGIGSFFGPLGWFIGNKVGEWTSEKIDAKKTEAWEKVLSETSPEGIAKLAEIQQRIENNKKLTKAQQDVINDISERLKNESEKLNNQENLDKGVANDYNTTDASSNTSPVSLTEMEEDTTGTKSSSSRATARGGDSGGPTTAFSNLERTKTKGGNFDISNVKQEYSDNYDKIVNGKLAAGEVGRVDGKVAHDGKERGAIFSEAIKEKIEKDHGLDKSNLLATVNDPDYIVRDVKGNEDKINLIKKIDGTNNFVIVGADRQNGFFILTNYEVISRNNKRLVKSLSNGEVIIDNVGDANSLTNSKKTTSKKTENNNEGLFEDVDQGVESEGLNPDALTLSDYKEMQRLNDGKYYSLSNALGKRSLKLYMAKKIATELVGNYDEIIADEFDPDNLEDEYVEKYNDVIDMYEGYEEYLRMEKDGDYDANTLKNTLSAADSYADKLYKGKTAKELIDQYMPEYKSDLEVYNRLDKRYPGIFDGKYVDITGLEGKSMREFANQENETAQDIDYQELAEMENETPQIEGEIRGVTKKTKSAKLD